MYRINFFGRVGYFNEVGEASDFAFQIYLQKKDEEIMKEFGVNPDKGKRSFLSLRALNTR